MVPNAPLIKLRKVKEVARSCMSSKGGLRSGIVYQPLEDALSRALEVCAAVRIFPSPPPNHRCSRMLKICPHHDTATAECNAMPGLFPSLRLGNGLVHCADLASYGESHRFTYRESGRCSTLGRANTRTFWSHMEQVIAPHEWLITIPLRLS
jgi:hypothetical protein